MHLNRCRRSADLGIARALGKGKKAWCNLSLQLLDIFAKAHGARRVNTVGKATECTVETA